MRQGRVLNRGGCAALGKTSLVGAGTAEASPMTPLAPLLVNKELLFLQKVFITVQDADPLCWV